MDREIFNETDRFFQEGKQNILKTKKEEIAPEYEERLQKANFSHLTRLKIISKSEYSYQDRKENDDRERQQFAETEAQIKQEMQDRITEETAKDIERLEFLYFPEKGRDGTLQNIEALEGAAKMNVAHQFNKKASEKNTPGYLQKEFDQNSGFVQEEKVETKLSNEFEISAANKNQNGFLRRDFRQADKAEEKISPSIDETHLNSPYDDYDFSEEDIHIEIDFNDNGFDSSNDNTPKDELEP